MKRANKRRGSIENKREKRRVTTRRVNKRRGTWREKNMEQKKKE